VGCFQMVHRSGSGTGRDRDLLEGAEPGESRADTADRQPHKPGQPRGEKHAAWCRPERTGWRPDRAAGRSAIAHVLGE
jgi:hypothetical protein